MDRHTYYSTVENENNLIDKTNYQFLSFNVRYNNLIRWTDRHFHIDMIRYDIKNKEMERNRQKNIAHRHLNCLICCFTP